MYQKDLLDGRVIFVTGAGTGLGRAMAVRAASLGARIGAVGRTEGTLAATVAAIREGGGTAELATADVRDPAAVHAAFDALESKLGPVDTLINNAAGNFLAASEDLSPNAFDAVVRIVLYGTFHCTSDFGKRLIAAGRKGSILNIVTTYAWTGSPFVLPSAAAKAGVLAMTRSLAVEWAHYGIRVNAIAPGPIPTEGAFAKLMPPDVEKVALARVPLRRFGTTEELADLAMYLLSPGAAYVTGDCVTMDGGEWLQSGAEFGGFTQWDRNAIKEIFRAMRPKK